MKSHFARLGIVLAVVFSCVFPLPSWADTVIWNRGAGTSNWSDGGNWSPAPPAAGDTASFANTGAGAVDMGGATRTAAGVSFSNDAGLPYTLQNGTLAVGAISRSGTGEATIQAQLNAPGVAGSVTGGLLTLTNLGNAAAGGMWTVSGGKLAAAGATTGNALGTAGVTLSGGTLELQAGVLILPGLGEKIFNGVPANAQDNIEGYRTAALGTSDAKGTLTSQLHYNDDGSVSTRAAALGAVGFDNGDFSMLWVSQFTPTESGAWGFRFNHVDDNASIWIDYDRNGVFSQSGAAGNERIYSRGCCAGSGDVFSLTTLTAGQTYTFGVVMSDTGGGGDLRDFEVKSPSGGWVDLTPSALGTLFTTPTNTAWTGANAVAVTANSGIRVGTDVPAATLGSLTMAPDTTLTVDAASKQALTFATSTTLTGGTATIQTANQAMLVLNNVGETAASNLTLGGNGKITLATANTYTGVTTIAPGVTVLLGNNAALGDEGGKTVIQSGGTLDIAGRRAGANGNELVEVQGTGVGGNGAIINTGAANGDAFRRVTMTGDALFRSDSRWDIRSTGGAATFDMGGYTLTKVGAQEFCLVNTGVVNPGNVNVNQGIFRIEGSTVFTAPSKTINVVNGASLDFWNSSSTHAVAVALANGGNLTTNGGGGPTISGPVGVTGSANVVGNNNLTLSGPVSGGTLVKTGGATLYLNNPANTFAGVTVNAGRVRAVGSANVLGATAQVAPRAYLEFDGTMTAGGGTLSSITLAGGTIGAYNGTVTFNSTFNTLPDVDINFEGSGDIVVNQPVGYSGPVPVNAFRHYGYNANDDNRLMDLNNNGGMLNNLNPTAVSGYYGRSLLTTGPGGRGLNFDSDADFQTAGAVSNGDNYSNLFLGTLHVEPALAGTWSFQFLERDDPCGIWIDLDRNGKFESTVAGLGSDRGEQLSWNDYRVPKNVTLAAGDYMIAFTHREGGGGSQIDAQYKAPGMASFATIQPTLGSQAGLFPVTPTGGLNKAGTGTLTLNAANVYDGATTVTGGAIVAGHNLAFGKPGGGIVLNTNTSVGLANNVTVAGENITGADGKAPTQSGSLSNVSGNNAFLGNIAAADIPNRQQISIASQSGTLTVGAAGGGNTINLNFSSLTLDGSGSVVINSDIYGRTAPAAVNALRHYGFHVNNDGVAMDLNNNGGMWNNGNPTAFSSFYGLAALTAGPGNRGLDFNDDNDFINTGAIGQVDNYSNLFIGLLHVDASKAGNWNLRINQQDDPTGIWIDLDRDGVFESSTAGLGSDRGEQLLWSAVATRTVSLTAGDYLVAFTHREGGGGSGIEAQFQAPGMGALTMIKPSDPAQAGIWQTIITPNNELVKTGTGTATLLGNNTYGGITRVQQGTLIAASPNALGSTSAGTQVTAGGTLGIQGGITLANEALTLNGTGAAGQSGALVNLGGNNTVPGPIVAQNVEQGEFRIASSSGELTVAGGVDMRYSKLSLGGASTVRITGNISSSAAAGEVAGLNERIFNRVVGDAQNDPTTYGNAAVNADDGKGVLIGRLHYPDDNSFSVRAAALGAVGFDNGDFSAFWSGNFTPNADGQWGFRFDSVDDNVSIWVDYDRNGVFSTAGLNGNERVYLRGCCGASGDQFTLALSSGQAYPFAIALSDTGGGGYLSNMQVKSPLGGWEALDTSSAGAGSLFSRTVTPRNDLVKVDAGTAILSGNNTYLGTTYVQQGTLIAASNNALGSTAAGTVVSDGATLGLQGGVTISGESLTIGQPTAANTPGLRSLSGSNTWSGPVQLAQVNKGQGLISTDPGASLTLANGLNMDRSSLIVDGAGETVINGAITGIGTGAHYTLGGLNGYYYNLAGVVGNDEPSRNALIQPNGNVIAMDALTPQVTKLTPRIDFGSGTETVAGDGSVLDRDGSGGNLYGGIGVNIGADQVAGMWKGYLKVTEAGDYRFTTRSDDGSRVWLDVNQNGTFEAGELVADLPTHGGMRNDSRGAFTLAPGFYAIKAATYEGGGGAGMQVSWEKTSGAGTFGRRIIAPEFLSSGTFQAQNDLIKRGTGTLTLGGDSTYDGQTIVEQGRLNVNGSIVSAVTVQAGGVLGGTGRIYNSIGGAGLISPGLSPGVLTANNINPAGGIDFGFQFSNGAGDTAGNDVLKLTDVPLAFLSPLDGDNTVNIYLMMSDIPIGTRFAGGFQTPDGFDLLAAIQNADWRYWVLGGGANQTTFEGLTYIPLEDRSIDHFFTFAVENGTLVLETQVPEPATMGLLALAIGGMGRYLRRRRTA